MKKPRLILRMDDACPEMDKKLWGQMETLLDRYGIKPIVAVVPDCQDPHLKKDVPDKNFWNNVHKWQEKGWTVALHGYDHVYCGKKKGLVPLNRQTEFAGIPIDIQREKIKKGWSIFKAHGLEPKVWIAPSHTFDRNTLRCLKEETTIRIISDGLSRTPFTRFGFSWVPQQLWGPKSKLPLGVWTLCYHPNEMIENKYIKLEAFIEKHADWFIKFDEALQPPVRKWNIGDWFFAKTFIMLRTGKTWIAKILRKIGIKK